MLNKDLQLSRYYEKEFLNDEENREKVFKTLSILREELTRDSLFDESNLVKYKLAFSSDQLGIMDITDNFTGRWIVYAPTLDPDESYTPFWSSTTQKPDHIVFNPFGTLSPFTKQAKISIEELADPIILNDSANSVLSAYLTNQENTTEIINKMGNIKKAITYNGDALRILMQMLLSIILLIPSLWVILSKKYEYAERNWAFATIGVIIGFWLG